MKETHIPNLNVDPVAKRLERIVEEKKAANEEALGKIKSLTGSWEVLNKSIEEDIKGEFEVMDLEDQALVEALGDLKKNRTKPDKGAFTITGKALSAKEKIGLPNVVVLVLKRVGRKTSPLDKTVTDNLGNFVFRLGKDAFTDNNRIKLDVEYQVYSSDGTLLLSEIKSLSPRLGGIAQATLAVDETDVVSNQLEAGKAVKDSIVDSRKLVASRVENMRSAHSALAKMTSITREELGTLNKALAVAPPEIKTVISKPGSGDENKGGAPGNSGSTEKPEQPVDEKPKKPAVKKKAKKKPRRPQQKIPGLAAINGLGPQRVKKLKLAKIKDIKTFIATDNRKLTEILGDLDFKAMKKDARVLLKKK
jgi:hypothetical protein